MLPKIVKLWGVGTARTLRVHWALSELAIPYELVANQSRDGSTQKSEFLERNPSGKIPVLQYGQHYLCESAAIVTFLGLRHQDKLSLVPGHGTASSIEFAKYMQWMLFIMTELDAHTLYIIRRHHPRGLAHLCGESEAAVEEAVRGFHRQVAVCAKHLEDGNKQFMLGHSFTGLDLLLATSLSWANRMSKYLATPLVKQEVLHEYVKRCEARPAFAAAQAKNTPAKPLTDFA